MRFLFLSQARQIEDQPDFHASFLKAVGGENYLNVPYRASYDQGGWPLLERKILEANEDFRPDVIYFQFFHSPEKVHPRTLLRNLKNAPNHPMIFGSLGDLFDMGAFAFLGRPLPPSITELCAETDAFFTTSMGATAQSLVVHGGKNIVFLPNAYCPEHFPVAKTMSDKLYDVVMLGNSPRFASLHPLVSVPTAWKRRFVSWQLARAFGERLGIYGQGWKGISAHGGVPFKEQVELFRKSRIVVDAPPRFPEELYSSDRPYFICGAGASLVIQYTPKMEMLFEPNVHAHFVYRLRDSSRICKNVLALPKDVREEKECLTFDYIHSRNHVSHRVDTILSTVEALQGHRSGELTVEEALNHLRLWHFRPELSKGEVLRVAVANWKG